MPRNKRSGVYWVRSALVFVMHQIIGTEGVIWLTVLGAFVLRGSIREVHEPWGNSALLRGMGWILTNTPFFPIQIAAGAYIGWKLWRGFPLVGWSHGNRGGRSSALSASKLRVAEIVGNIEVAHEGQEPKSKMCPFQKKRESKSLCGADADPLPPGTVTR
jgi:hypothetical protein